MSVASSERLKSDGLRFRSTNVSINIFRTYKQECADKIQLIIVLHHNLYINKIYMSLMDIENWIYRVKLTDISCARR